MITTNVYENLRWVCVIQKGAENFNINDLTKIVRNVDEIYISITDFLLNNMNFNNAIDRLTMYYAVKNIEEEYMYIDYICRFKGGNIALFKDTRYGVDMADNFAVLLVKEYKHGIQIVDYSAIDINEYNELLNILTYEVD